MRLRIHLIAAAVLASVTTQARADGIYCTVNVSADKTNVCVGETVNISIDSTTCTNGETIGAGTNYSTSYGTAGVYTVSASCSACISTQGEADGLSSLNIYVGQLNGISPSSATICPGNYMVFTAESVSNNIPCGPIWGLSQTNAGTLSAVGNTATFTLSPTYGGSTAIITASCGTATDTATVNVASSGTFAITTQPVSVVTCTHSQVTFSVGATGSSLSYQWLWNGVILTNGFYVILTNSPSVVLTNGGRISGATNSTLTVSNVFATTSVSNPVIASNNPHAYFGELFAGDLCTYQATGCVSVHGIYMADPDGNTYTNGDCVPASFFAGPTLPYSPGTACGDLIAYSLVNSPARCFQFGSQGQFQAAGIIMPLFLCMNDNSREDDSGSWEATVNHTLEGAYSCIVSSSCGSQLSAAATLFVSTPCDDIPDSWRLEYFGTTNATGDMCASCYYTNSDLDNLQDYQCGFDPLVPIVITTPTSVYSGMFSNMASIPAAGEGVSYSWSVSNGTITSGSNTTTVLWTAGNAGSVTLSVTLSGSPSCNATITTNIAVTPAYYIDYQNGNDGVTYPGTNPATAWKHCPGDQSPGVGPGPADKTLHPGDTVLFRGGSTYTLVGKWDGIYTEGIDLNWSGTNNAPITYSCSPNWGPTNRVIFTDGQTTNYVAAFYSLGNVSNLVFNNLEFGPIGGEPSPPAAGTPSGTAYTITPSNGPVFFPSNVSGVNFAVPMTFNAFTNATSSDGSPQTDTEVGYIQNDGSQTVTGTMTCLGGPFVPVNTNFSINAGSYTAVSIAFGPTAATGVYTNGVTFRFNNAQGQVLTNELIGSACTPSRNGYGIWVNGAAMLNCTISNCYFHDLGYWYNQSPLSANTVSSGDTRPSSQAISFNDAIGVNILNCEFTKCHTAIDFLYGTSSYNASSNDVISGCYTHDYVVWGIYLAGPASTNVPAPILDHLAISNNTLSGIGWAYSTDYWTGYGTPPHQDPLFHVTNGNASNGPNINICFNTFRATHTNEETSGYIYLESSPSANIYNNLFDVANAGDPYYGEKVISMSIENNLPGLIRILNNTIIINTTNTPGLNAPASSIGWGCGTGLYPALSVTNSVWPNDYNVVIENNLTYDFYNGSGQDLDWFVGVVSNPSATNNWTVNYNDWHEPSTELNAWFCWTTNVFCEYSGGLAEVQALGFESHGLTNDPQFVSLAYGCTTNSSGNDYRITTNSLCSFAGTNLTALNLPGLNLDLNGNPRPANTNWDIGAYQH